MIYYKSTLDNSRLAVFRAISEKAYLQVYNTKKGCWENTSFLSLENLNRIWYNRKVITEIVTESEANKVIMALELLK